MMPIMKWFLGRSLSLEQIYHKSFAGQMAIFIDAGCLIPTYGDDERISARREMLSMS
jgi:hypothetical protein